MQDKSNNVLHFNKGIMLFALLILVCVACGLFLGINSTTIAYADEQSQLVEDYQSEEFLSLYLDSDYLYDRNEHRNQTSKIQDYESSNFCANGDNAITQIIPKEYFINTCITAKMGKE